MSREVGTDRAGATVQMAAGRGLLSFTWKESNILAG